MIIIWEGENLFNWWLSIFFEFETGVSVDKISLHYFVSFHDAAWFIIKASPIDGG